MQMSHSSRSAAPRRRQPPSPSAQAHCSLLRAWIRPRQKNFPPEGGGNGKLLRKGGEDATAAHLLVLSVLPAIAVELGHSR